MLKHKGTIVAFISGTLLWYFLFPIIGWWTFLVSAVAGFLQGQIEVQANRWNRKLKEWQRNNHDRVWDIET